MEKIEREKNFERKKKAEVYSDWSKIVSSLKNVKNEDLTSVVIESFIQSPTSKIDRMLIENYIDRSTDEKRIISTVGLVMSLPEFQLI